MSDGNTDEMTGTEFSAWLDEHRIGEADCDCLDLSHCKLPLMNGAGCDEKLAVTRRERGGA